MALQTLIALLGLHLVDANLLAAAVLDDVAGDDGALDNRSAEYAACLVDDGENAVKLDGGTGLGVELLDVDDVALSHAVLLTAGLDNCMLHLFSSSLIETRSWGGNLSASLPCQCGSSIVSRRGCCVNSYFAFSVGPGKLTVKIDNGLTKGCGKVKSFEISYKNCF